VSTEKAQRNSREGVVQRGTNSWSYVIELPPDLNGQRRQKWVSGFRTKGAAVRARRAALVELDNGTYLEPTKQTVKQYLSDVWLPAIRQSVRPSTFSSYKNMIDLHVAPHVGNAPLRRLDAASLNELYASLLEGTPDRRALSRSSTAYIHRIVHRSLRDAMRWGYIGRNPADLAEPPRVPRRDMTVWTTGQIGEFLQHVRSDRLYALWLLAFTTGMRRGELLGLRWPDVDLNGARLSVVQTLITVRGEVQFSEPKTAKSRRSLSLDAATVAVLRAHRKAQLEDRIAWGPDWTDTGLVFTRENGERLHPVVVSRQFLEFAAAAGLPRIRFHDTRHSYATAALSAGVHPKVVSERLGHSTISMTLDLYSHVMPVLAEEAATLVANLILRPS
jgi:integrase